MGAIFKAIVLLGIFCFLFFNCNHFEKIRATDQDKRVVFTNCQGCHAPSDYLNGIPQDEMLKKFSTKELKKILKAEFEIPRNGRFPEHKQVLLSRKEINSIIIFLIDIGKPDYYPRR